MPKILHRGTEKLKKRGEEKDLRSSKALRAQAAFFARIRKDSQRLDFECGQVDTILLLQ